MRVCDFEPPSLSLPLKGGGESKMLLSRKD
jgi:hypothetical protein